MTAAAADAPSEQPLCSTWHINAADYRAEWSTLPPLHRICRESMKTIRRFICGLPKSIGWSCVMWN